MARAYRFVFAESYANTPDVLQDLRECVRAAKKAMQHCFEGVRETTFTKTSNFHAADHTAETARLFGLPKLTSCSRGEAKHCAIRAVNKHCNHKFEEFDMLVSQNVRQAILFLACGGWKHLRGIEGLYTPEVLQLFVSDKTVARFIKQAGVNDTYVGHDEDDDGVLVEGTATLRKFQHTDDRGVEHYLEATIPDRQAFTARVKVGGFFTCTLDDSEHIVRLDKVLRHNNNISITVVVLTNTNTHTHRGLPIYHAGLPPRNILLDCILQPVHLYPLCHPHSACTITAIRPIPHHFNTPCTALNGNHVCPQLQQYVHNTFLAK